VRNFPVDQWGLILVTVKWLESFVRNGTAQINGLATNVERLCRDLCSEPELSRAGILNDIYTVLLELRSRNDPSMLQYSVDKLAEIINANSANTMSESLHSLQGLIPEVVCRCPSVSKFHGASETRSRSILASFYCRLVNLCIYQDMSLTGQRRDIRRDQG